jgi:hypothetical protein
MIKIMITCRNRLAITKKCIEAIQKHTELPYQIYIYDNLTNYLLDDHFKYFNELYKNKIISQVTFMSQESTFDAFSKCVASNIFGLQHEQDPNKDQCEFLLLLDNDIILTNNWDVRLKYAWRYVKKNHMNNIYVIGQLPGGIKSLKPDIYQITDKMNGKIGYYGGSGLWSVRSDFFSKVSLLDLTKVVGKSKQHDQLYWKNLSGATKGEPYIMGLSHKLGIHCGKLCGSVCNVLTQNSNNKRKEDLIKFVEAEKRINELSFDNFYEQIKNDISLSRDW